MTDTPKTAVVIVAAGRGSRFGAEGPKQYQTLGSAPVIAHSLRQFAAHDRIDLLQPVIHAGDRDLYDSALAGGGFSGAKLLTPVAGGAARQASVLAGLEALAQRRDGPPAFVLIHDAARPLVSAALISRVLDGLERAQGSDGVVPALPVTDTLKRADNGAVAETISRDDLVSAQTPQGFRFRAIVAAHRSAAEKDISDLSDDAAVAELAQLTVNTVPGEPDNIKITRAEDLARAARILTAGISSMETRTGSGFDVHRFGTGDHVMLGGVNIPHTHALEGHSDADVALHALTDALLGALGEKDIGSHFPPSDPQWRGAASAIFLQRAAALIAQRGGHIINVDVTVICQAPRIGPHSDAMRTTIAELLDIAPARVAVKATTTEGLGFTGRGEGIAAQAVANVALPPPDENMALPDIRQDMT